MIQYRDLREASAGQTIAWLEDLAGNLRPSDLDEIAATCDLDPLLALTTSVMLSELVWVILVDGTPAAVFGCAPSGPADSGLVWMMGAPAMDERRAAISIARQTVPYLQRMHRRFACLWNYIDARNDRSMRWLGWCGFRLLEAHPEHGPQGRLFYTFARYAPDV